jgi:hypothetical protein
MEPGRSLRILAHQRLIAARALVMPRYRARVYLGRACPSPTALDLEQAIAREWAGILAAARMD